MPVTLARCRPDGGGAHLLQQLAPGVDDPPALPALDQSGGSALGDRDEQGVRQAQAQVDVANIGELGQDTFDDLVPGQQEEIVPLLHSGHVDDLLGGILALPRNRHVVDPEEYDAAGHDGRQNEHQGQGFIEEAEASPSPPCSLAASPRRHVCLRIVSLVSASI